MKYFFLIFLLFSCNSKSSKPDKFDPQLICIKQITYNGLKNSFGTPSVRVKIKIEDPTVLKKINSNDLKNIVLFSITKEDRKYFRLDDYRPYVKKDSLFEFRILTGFFIDVPFNKHKWTNQEIQKAINGDVGLVFDTDTVRVKKCEAQPAIMIND